MGRIAQNLTKTFLREERKIKGAAKGFTDGLPFDLPTLEELAKNLNDPQHVLYVSAQQFSSAFAESVSGWPEFSEYASVVGQAEEMYLPKGPPMSPLTVSFFTMWAFFDVRFGRDHESIGSCLMDLMRAMNGPDFMVAVLQNLCDSRMGIYEHVGRSGSHVRLRELLSGEEFVCHSTSGYVGKTGELWYVRLAPPVAESFDYHIVLTTPYVLIGQSREDWTAFLNRSLVDAADQRSGLRDLLKHGSDNVNWSEFVMNAYHHHQFDAIFLTGLPDVAGSLPHSPEGEALLEAQASVGGTPFTGNIEERLRCKLTEAQRRMVAELRPEFSSQLKLDEPNQRTVEFTRSELDSILEPARAALPEAIHSRQATLRKLIQVLADAPRQMFIVRTIPRPISRQRSISDTSSRQSRGAKGTQQIYQFRVDLCGSKPPIWRRFQVADCTLEDLHFVLQNAMGWQDSHLYEFEVRGVRYSSPPPLDSDWDDNDDEDAGGVRISELIPTNHRLQLRYLYDFGDSWEHVVKLEKVLMSEPGTQYPLCVKGARACPPEDCGGIYGYYNFVEAISNPNHEEHEDMLDWHGPYNPEAFDASAATKAMRSAQRWGMS